MNSPELNNINGRISELRKKLQDIFAEAGPENDMDKVKSLDGDSQSKVDQIRAFNDELTDLGRKRDTLTTLIKAAQNAVETGEGLSEGTEFGGAPTKSVIDQILESGALKMENRTKQFDLDVDVKVLMTTAAGWAPAVVRSSRFVDYAQIQPDLLSFIPTTTTSSAAVTYMEETTFTNSAAEVAEGLAKPESALAFTERSVTVRKIATLLPVTDEQLEDEPRIRGIIENRLAFMVRQKLASQIVNGSGIAPAVRGILNVVGIQTQAKGADPTPDAVYKAMTKVRVTGQAEPDAFLVAPADWEEIRLLRTVDGIYIWGSPSEAGPEMIWGLNAIIVPQLTAGTGVVGAWKQYSELAVRRGLTVDVGYQNDDFGKNLQTFRAEIRAVPVFYRPSAFCTVTGI